jgi:hypothetical protein
LNGIIPAPSVWKNTGKKSGEWDIASWCHLLVAIICTYRHESLSDEESYLYNVEVCLSVYRDFHPLLPFPDRIQPILPLIEANQPVFEDICSIMELMRKELDEIAEQQQAAFANPMSDLTSSSPSAVKETSKLKGQLGSDECNLPQRDAVRTPLLCSVPIPLTSKIRPPSNIFISTRFHGLSFALPLQLAHPPPPVQKLCAELDECIRHAEEELPDPRRWAPRAAAALRALAPHPRGPAAAAARLRAWAARDPGGPALLLPEVVLCLSAAAVRDEEGAAAALAWIVDMD